MLDKVPEDRGYGNATRQRGLWFSDRGEKEMKERRFFQRVDLELQCNLYLKGKGNGDNEFVGTILDVSEEGMKVSVSLREFQKLADEITEGSKLNFQAVDRMEKYGSERMFVLHGSACVVRIDEVDGMVVLGCKVYPGNASFDEFVRGKKVTLFLQQLYGRKKEQ